MTQGNDKTAGGPLTSSDFLSLLAIHGADLSRWPVESVRPALELIAEDSHLSALFAREEVLDDFLRRDGVDGIDESRLEKIRRETQARLGGFVFEDALPPLASSLSQTALPVLQTAGVERWLARAFAPAGAVMMVALFGFFTGLTAPAQAQDTLWLAAYAAPQSVVGDQAFLTMEW